MAGENLGKSRAEPAPADDPGSASRQLIRCALKGALGTLERQSGHPYASLVTVAAEADGTPLFLISRLALHTQNLVADPRASLLIDGTGKAGDPLAGGRLTLVGQAKPAASPAARARFLARHPHAEQYAGFPDFAFYALKPERAHYVGGFGRIVDLGAAALLLDLGDAAALIEAEADIVAHMNEDHAGTIELFATALCRAPGGPWRMTGIDPEGCDIVCDGEARRVTFAVRVTSPGEVRHELVRLAGEARTRGNMP